MKYYFLFNYKGFVNHLNAELNPICYLLALLGAHHFLHVSRIRVKYKTWITYSLTNLVSNFENSDTCRAHYYNAWGSGHIAFQILNINNRFRRSASPDLFTLADSIPKYSFIGWMGPRASLDASKYKKISCNPFESDHGSSLLQHVAWLWHRLRWTSTRPHYTGVQISTSVLLFPSFFSQQNSTSCK